MGIVNSFATAVCLIADIQRTTEESPAGEIVTFTREQGGLGGLFLFGVLMFGLGCGALWLTWRFLHRNGRLIKMSLMMMLIGVVIPFTEFRARNDKARVTPDEVELNVDGEITSFRVADVVDQKTFAVEGRKGNKTWHCKFFLRDGTEHVYLSDSVAGRAFDKVRSLRTERTLAAREAADAQLKKTVSESAAAGAIRGQLQIAQQQQQQERQQRQLQRQQQQRREQQQQQERQRQQQQRATMRKSRSIATAPTSTLKSTVEANGAMPQRPLLRPAAAPAPDRPQPVHELPASYQSISPATPLKSGMRVLVKWGGAYYPSDILELAADSKVKVHYLGFSDTFDAFVPRDDVWIDAGEPATDAPAESSHAEASETKHSPAAVPGETASQMRRSASAETRTWTDNTGKHKVEASLEKVENGSVNLIRADGKRVTLPLQRLSAADIEYLGAAGYSTAGK